MHPGGGRTSRGYKIPSPSSFYFMVIPALLYGSEVWHLTLCFRKTNPCDTEQLGFLRRLAGVCQSTSGLYTVVVR